MANKCGACGRFINATDCAKCSGCVCHFHRQCVNIPQEAKMKVTWLCPGCKVKTPRKSNIEHPVAGTDADYTCPQEASSDDLMREMLQEMRSFRAEFNGMRDDINSMRATIECFSGRMDGIETRVAALESTVAELLARPTTNDLVATIERLKAEIGDRDQDALLNDVEISGLPEERGENLGHLMCIIAGKLGVSCEERDLVSVERWGGRRAPSEGESSAARPRPVVVRLARRQLRDALLQGARVRRHITTEGLALGVEPAATPRRLYLNERLTRQNKALFYKVREESRRQGWKYAWTRNGRIFVRRESGKASHRVQTESDFHKIFGSGDV